MVCSRKAVKAGEPYCLCIVGYGVEQEGCITRIEDIKEIDNLKKPTPGHYPMKPSKSQLDKWMKERILAPLPKAVLLDKRHPGGLPIW